MVEALESTDHCRCDSSPSGFTSPEPTSTPASQANWVWFPLGPPSVNRLQLSLPGGWGHSWQYGEDGVRVTIAETEANDRLIQGRPQLQAELTIAARVGVKGR